MALGNGNPKEGDKGSNFNYELKVLQGLEAIAIALENGGGSTPKFISVLDGTTVTGTTLATKSTSVLIPGGTVAVGDSIFIRTRCIRTGKLSSSTTQEIYINTTNQISTGVLVASNTLRVDVVYNQLSRTIVIKPGKTISRSQLINVSESNYNDDDAASNLYPSDFSIDWSIDQYFIFGFTNSVVETLSATTYYEVIVNKG